MLGGKQPVDVVADYLCCLRNHTLDVLKRKYSRAFLAETPIDYVMTVPAVSVLFQFGFQVADLVKMWSDVAKSLTLQAAESAGFGRGDAIRLVSEPDAAAAWTLLRNIQPHNLKVRDNQLGLWVMLKRACSCTMHLS